MKLEIDTQAPGGVKRKTVSIKKSANRPFTPSADLFEVSGERAQYAGYVIDEIRVDEGTVSFSNGHVVKLGETHGAQKDDLMRVQIRETVRTHLDRELRVQSLLNSERLKVLSLFFIGRVAHYADADGKIRQWFIEAWEELAVLPRYSALNLPARDLVHNGYAVAYDSTVLIEKAAQAIQDMPAVTTPRIISERASLSFDETGIQSDIQSVREHASSDIPISVPDILGYLQHETELTRHTLVDILTQTGRLHDVLVNPQQFLDEALKAIRGVLQQLMVDGVKYERIGDAEYEMQVFESRELEAYLSSLVKVDKSITDHIEFDSEVERNFAEKLDRMDNVKLFVKLPGWFRINTPVGSYNPDWAIVLECDEKLYLVRETKGATDTAQLRWSELARIKCGKAHFDELDVDYKHISSADDIRCPG